MKVVLEMYSYNKTRLEGGNYGIIYSPTAKRLIL